MLKLRAAGLIKKCCAKGTDPSHGIVPVISVEFERQLDYIPTNDHDDGD